MSQKRTQITLVPEAAIDRNNALLGFFNLLLGIFWLVIADSFSGYLVAALLLILMGTSFTAAYLFQEQPKTAEENEYAKMISQIEGTQDALQTLNKFLVKERKRVHYVEEAVIKLNQEHEALAPVVETKREDVDAILAAYTRAARTSVWKERFMGFGFGLLSSILAGGILYWLEYLQR